MQDLDRKVEEALACPCVADLREGPCGKPFVDAFSCYVKSTAEDKVRHAWSCLDSLKDLLPGMVSGTGTGQLRGKGQSNILRSCPD